MCQVAINHLFLQSHAEQAPKYFYKKLQRHFFFFNDWIYSIELLCLNTRWNKLLVSGKAGFGLPGASNSTPQDCHEQKKPQGTPGNESSHRAKKFLHHFTTFILKFKEANL